MWSKLKVCSNKLGDIRLFLFVSGLHVLCRNLDRIPGQALHGNHYTIYPPLHCLREVNLPSFTEKRSEYVPS